MNSELGQIFYLIRPSCKTGVRCGPGPVLAEAIRNVTVSPKVGHFTSLLDDRLHESRHYAGKRPFQDRHTLGPTVPIPLLGRDRQRRSNNIRMLFAAVHESAIGPEQTYVVAAHTTAYGRKAYITIAACLLLRSLLGVKRT